MDPVVTPIRPELPHIGEAQKQKNNRWRRVNQQACAFRALNITIACAILVRAHTRRPRRG